MFAQLGDRRARRGLAALLNRRIVAPRVLARFLATGPRDLDIAGVARRAAGALIDVFEAMPGGLDRFLDTGPLEPAFVVLVRGAAAPARRRRTSTRRSMPPRCRRRLRARASTS